MENREVMITQEIGAIKMNFEEMKQYLEDRLHEYDGAVFTEDSAGIAKKCVAQLRKEQKDLKGRITQVKAEYMKPFEEFKAQADQLVALYDKPINAINGQVADYETARKAEKRKKIEAAYQELAADLEEYLPLDYIFDQRWENVTTKMKEIEECIRSQAEETRKDLRAISAMESDVMEKALALYKRGHNALAAITYITDYERQKAEILKKDEERKRQEEEERIRREERKRIEEEQRAAAEKEAEVEAAKNQAREEAVEILIPEVGGEETDYIYRLTLTEDAKRKLELYLDSVGIEWQAL